MSIIVPVGVGALAGLLTAFGLGGGSLLLLYLSVFTDMEQQQVAGLGLLFFISTAASALPLHGKEGQLEMKAAWPAIVAGVICGGVAAWAASSVDTKLLHRIFGGFLVLIGLYELFRKRE